MELKPREIYEPTHLKAIPKCTLTVIVPLRITKERRDVLERLQVFPGISKFPKEVGFLVVDSGSKEEDSEQVRSICRSRGFGYLKIETGHEIFALGIARNHGAMYAQSEYILFQDVDFFVMEDFYERLLIEVNSHVNDHDFVFFSPPVVNLTDVGTSLWVEKKVDLKQIFDLFCYGKAGNLVELSAPLSACIAIRRVDFLLHGGYLDTLKGWGCEEWVLAASFVVRNNLFPLSLSFELIDSYHMRNRCDYKYMRACLRLLGDCVRDRRLVVFHFFHPDQSRDKSNLEQNRKIASSEIKMYMQDSMHGHLALPMLPQAVRTLIDASWNSVIISPFLFAPAVQIYCYKPQLVPFSSFKDEDDICGFVWNNNIQRILVPNTRCGHPKRFRFVQYLKKRGIVCICVERGALPESVYFDPGGFCNESNSYSSEEWDFPLLLEERRDTLSYIQETKENGKTLERQEQSIGALELRRKLKISDNAKILFVPLQRPSDTTIVYHCGSIGTFGNFIQLINKIAETRNDWVVVAKKHPLEDDVCGLSSKIIYCNHDENIRDLLDLCDCVLLINSGVGVLAMLWNKPVIIAGKAFFASKGINVCSSSLEEVNKFLNNLPYPNWEKVVRFINYLVHKFYSFGTLETVEEMRSDKRIQKGKAFRQTITKAIYFTAIRGLDTHGLRLTTPRKQGAGFIYTIESPVFDRFRHWFEYTPEGMHFCQKTSLSISLEKGRPFCEQKNVKCNLSSAFRFFSYLIIIRCRPFVAKYKKLKRDPKRFFSESRFVFLQKISLLLFRKEKRDSWV
jgi:predicted glycosyltransferase involved in capsule biosynthesis